PNFRVSRVDGHAILSSASLKSLSPLGCSSVPSSRDVTRDSACSQFRISPTLRLHTTLFPRSGGTLDVSFSGRRVCGAASAGSVATRLGVRDLCGRLGLMSSCGC
ncbi:unnamed protein product, partial [Ectocarpus sp. 8 AP-2014]